MRLLWISFFKKKHGALPISTTNILLFTKKAARGFKHQDFRNILVAVIILEILMDQSYTPSRYEKSTLLNIAVLLVVMHLHGL